MSLKLIELQVALPRTQDAGKIQGQFQQQGQLIQDQLAAKLHKEDERKRKQVQKNEQKDKVLFHSETHDVPTEPILNHHAQREENDQHHPYKGNNIDFVG